MSTLYPWQTAIWTQLNRDKTRLPHALLLHGRAGIGKFEFAISLSQALLCPTPTTTHIGCGQCASCNWFSESAHPDFKLLTPEQDAEPDETTATSKKTKKKTNISVAQIRDLSEFLTKSSHQSTGLKIVLLHPAETLNLASANALLKMLEEPSAGVIFILLTHHIQRLLPTILSRCQKISMPVPSEREATTWLSSQKVEQASAQLAYFEGSPLKVLQEQAQYLQMKDIWRSLALGKKISPFMVAQALLSANSLSSNGAMEASIVAMQKWIYDIVSCRFTGQARYHPHLLSTFHSLSENVHLKGLFALQKSVLALRKLTSHPLNQELQLEAILQDYSKIFTK
jgi:DNA polymerase III subunit delta'